MRTSVRYAVKLLTERCEGITSAGLQCKCWATQRVNDIPYCEQHAAKVLREAGKDEPQR